MKYILTIIIVAIIVFAGFSYFRSSPVKNEQGELTKQTQELVTKWNKISDEQGPIQITVTPEMLGAGSEQWKFGVEFTAHSGALDLDPLKAITLADEKGNSSVPIEWIGAGPGGHHRVGVIVFSPVSPIPESVSLHIKDVGGVKERAFTWQIK